MFKINNTTHFLVKAFASDIIPYCSQIEYNYLLSFESLLQGVNYYRDIEPLITILPPPNDYTEILMNLKKVASALFKDSINKGKIIMYLIFLKKWLEYLKLKFSLDFYLVTELAQHLDNIWTKWLYENGCWVRFVRV